VWITPARFGLGTAAVAEKRTSTSHLASEPVESDPKASSGFDGLFALVLLNICAKHVSATSLAFLCASIDN